MSTYLVATIKDWNIDAFHRHVGDLPGEWHLITSRDALNMALIEKLSPRYIFFPHWSWIVPQDILEAADCVCFHMTDVPYGRGGSPLQNLIVRGHQETKLTALRMAKELDAGPVYLKKPLSLEGRAQDIFERVADLVYEMIAEIVAEEPEPAEQSGEATVFERRTPEMSALPERGDMEALYNHIRMLDAESYPPAFIDYGDFRITFKNAEPCDGSGVSAQVEIAFKKKD